MNTALKLRNGPTWPVSGSMHCPVQSTPSVYLPNTCEMTAVLTTSSWTAVTRYLVSGDILKLDQQGPSGSTRLSVTEINIQLSGHTPRGQDDKGWKPNLITGYSLTRKSSSNDVPVIYQGPTPLRSSTPDQVLVKTADPTQVMNLPDIIPATFFSRSDQDAN